MPGHPDGQNYAIWRGPDFFASSAQHVDSATPIVAQGLVTSYASLVVNANSAITGGITVTADWYTDATFAIRTVRQQWDLPTLMNLDAILPCLGNFVQVVISTTSVAGGSIPASIYPTNTPVDAPRYVSTKNILGGNAVVVPAATTLEFTLPAIGAGKGHVYFEDVTASTKLTAKVATLKIDSTQDRPLVNIPNPVTSFQSDFNAPDLPVGIFIANGDGVAAHNCNYSLHIDGR